MDGREKCQRFFTSALTDPKRGKIFCSAEFKGSCRYRRWRATGRASAEIRITRIRRGSARRLPDRRLAAQSVKNGCVVTSVGLRVTCAELKTLAIDVRY